VSRSGKSIVFLGGGRLTEAILSGLHHTKFARQIVVHDHHSEKLRKLRKLFNVRTESNLHVAIHHAEILMISVRPESIAGLLRDAGRIERPLVGVSLAAGVPISQLQSYAGAPVRWVRAMPSPACRFGRGLTAIAFGRNMPSALKLKVMRLFRQLGIVLTIPEKQFDAFTVVYSVSHGYHALDALTEAARRIGLDMKTAYMAAAHALADGIMDWRDRHISPADLLFEAATPGGTASVVLESLEADNYRSIVERALKAGIERARLLRKS
jgi:pyrroline-5-carboxylate reductase